MCWHLQAHSFGFVDRWMLDAILISHHQHKNTVCSEGPDFAVLPKCISCFAMQQDIKEELLTVDSVTWSLIQPYLMNSAEKVAVWAVNSDFWAAAVVPAVFFFLNANYFCFNEHWRCLKSGTRLLLLNWSAGERWALLPLLWCRKDEPKLLFAASVMKRVTWLINRIPLCSNACLSREYLLT